MKIDRLIGILSVLLQQEKVTAPYLAEKFEVSRRTIQRDLEALSLAGIPLVTTQGAGGGVSIMEGYKMDRTLLTTADMQAILAGLRSLDSVSGTNRYAQLMDKLAPGSAGLLPGDGHILIDLAAWDKGAIAPKIETIHQAIAAGRTLTFRYFAPGGASERRVEPYHLVFHWSSWYVWGWCRLRQDFRLFKCGRMADLTLGEPFEKRPAPLPDFSLGSANGEPCQVRAIVRPEHQWRLLESFGPESYCRQEDGRLLFSYQFADPMDAVRWIISFGGDAELLEPKALRREIAAFARKILEKHDT